MPQQTGSSYERRILIFFDVLGWKELVAKSVADPTLLPPIERTIASFEHMSGVFQHAAPAFRLSQFSDHFALSAPTSISGTLGFLTLVVRGAVLSMMALQRHCARGAIVVGDLIHEGNRIVGPALIQAHEIESEVARYPRIVLSDDAVALAAQENEPARLQIPLRTDVDGLTILDMFARVGIFGRTDPPRPATKVYAEGIRAYRDDLRRSLAQRPHPKRLGIRSQEGWLLNALEAADLED